jgi:hypothetical protein
MSAQDEIDLLFETRTVPLSEVVALIGPYFLTAGPGSAPAEVGQILRAYRAQEVTAAIKRLKMKEKVNA